MIVRESLDFEREGSPLKRLNIGILTWDKLKPGDILQNKKTVYFNERFFKTAHSINSRLYFAENEDTSEEIRPEKYWIIKTIRNDNTWNEKPGLEIELVWAGIFRHAFSMAERIKQSGDLKSKNLPNSYTSNKSIEEWNDYFKIILPEKYDLEESVHFERGVEPKVSMDIGNKWTRIKPGDVIKCIRKTVVEEKNNLDFLTFKDYVDGQYLGDRDYYFDPDNVAVIKYVVDLGENAGLRITIIPFSSEKEARDIKIDSQSLEYLSKTLYATVKGTAPIDTWAKYFKVL